MIDNKAKPFVKWAGGKTQLIGKIAENLPSSFLECTTYVEPFVGGGAVLFYILQNYKHLKHVIINDINHELISTYRTIKQNPKELIDILSKFETEFHAIDNEQSRTEYFIEKRVMFNSKDNNTLTSSALFIFLNKTCFNGLYRVNRNGYFNVPYGKYIKPVICDKETILTDSKLLQKVDILEGDFSETMKYAKGNVLFYCDPPYKPISTTSSFNSYAKDVFDDSDQERLKLFCDNLTCRGALLLQSNSSPSDNYFHVLYNRYRIEQVMASRMINSLGSKRGKIAELFIANYDNIASPRLIL